VCDVELAHGGGDQGLVCLTPGPGRAISDSRYLKCISTNTSSIFVPLLFNIEMNGLRSIQPVFSNLKPTKDPREPRTLCAANMKAN